MSRQIISQSFRNFFYFKQKFASNSNGFALFRFPHKFGQTFLFIQLIRRRINQVPISISGFAATIFSIAHMAAPDKFADLLQNSDQLFDENKFQEALDVLNNHEDQALGDLKWRQARAMYKISKIDKTNKDKLIRDGYTLVKEALDMNDSDYAVHKWMAILLDAKSELDGIKERVCQLENVKKHMKRAIELNPEDPTSWHLLGNFAFGLADMPWYQRKIVSAIFATPPTGTYDEALEHFLKAEEKKPNFYSMNLLYIGKCYQRLKNDEKAKHYLTLAANVPVLNEDDKNCKEEAAVLLKKY